MDDNVTFSDGVVSLRPFQKSDIDELTVAIRESIPELKPWMSWCHDDYSEDDTRNWIKSLPSGWAEGTQLSFVITDIHDGRLLGGCGLNHINPTYLFANLGYWVRTSRTGEGIASRAVRLLASFAFEQVKLVRVEIVVAVGNYPSLRVAGKVGARREGILRNRMLAGENIYDGVMHSLIPQDYGIELSKSAGGQRKSS
jgi:RimJ/RimL family protein N-acetyltransferase